jgi:tetratricopeptide (TPR) repeat protein
VGDQGRHDEALAFYEKGLEGRNNALGESHVDTLCARGNMSIMLYYVGRLTEALAEFQTVSAGREKAFGSKSHPLVLTTLHNQAVTAASLGDLSTAIPQLEFVLKERKRLSTGDNVATLTTVHNLGVLLMQQGFYRTAAGMFKESYDGRLQLLGSTHQETLDSEFNLDWALKYADASLQ